jgi:hypothetical protein
MDGFIATELLQDSLERHGIHLSLLVADTSLWSNPAVHKRLLEQTGGVAESPDVRRARAGEKQGTVVDGIRLDSNTYANVTIKRALGLPRQQLVGFEACHIWPLTCYDQRYHTAPANLVLIPRALAGLSDHNSEIQAALQYRSYELYDWWPVDLARPEKPEFYPDCWRPPLPDIVQEGRRGRRSAAAGARSMELDDAEVEMLAGRLVRWSTRPDSLVHRAIAVVMSSSEGLSRSQWVEEVGRLTGSRNPYGATSALFSRASGYGRVLVERDGVVALNPALQNVAESLRWRTG